MIKAVTMSGKSISETHVLDANGGLGVDAFMFASAGFRVTVLEKNPLVYTLLSDAVQRAKQVPRLHAILSRISIHHADAFEWFNQNVAAVDAPDVIYLDPMYPIESKMTAAPKKGMAIARALIGKTDRADDLVRRALTVATEKVVLKRPYYSAASHGTHRTYKSRSLRFEIFTRDSWLSFGEPAKPRVPAASQRLRSPARTE
jgi:16S rRNA (guanine1516-N2)-methyltransferase